jgi:hypothetical protein
MRRTLTIEPSAEITHVTRVNKKSTPVNLGVITTGSADSLVSCTTKSPIRIAMLKPATALSSAKNFLTPAMYRSILPQNRGG